MDAYSAQHRETANNWVAPVALFAMLVAGAFVMVRSLPIGEAPKASSTTSAKASVAVVNQRALRLEDTGGGGARIVEAGTGSVLAQMAEGEGGFVWTALRLLVVERRRFGQPLDAPFIVTHWSNGSITLADAAAGKTLELNAYGPTNASAFAALISTRGAP